MFARHLKYQIKRYFGQQKTRYLQSQKCCNLCFVRSTSISDDESEEEGEEDPDGKWPEVREVEVLLGNTFGLEEGGNCRAAADSEQGQLLRDSWVEDRSVGRSKPHWEGAQARPDQSEEQGRRLGGRERRPGQRPAAEAV